MIVIPMAGLSSRFFKYGYKKPKYMLIAHNKTLFEHSVNSFSKYFESVPFLFIIKDAFETEHFVKSEATKMGIINFQIVVLTSDTRGQAETVALGLKKSNFGNQPLTIFNIDTFRPDFEFPNITDISDGYLEVFQGEGDNWSFVLPDVDNSTRVVKTTEKDPISDLCCTGLYHFASVELYMKAYNEYLKKPQLDWEKGELYVAPLYNSLIQDGCNIFYYKISCSDVTFCGVPSEYENFINNLGA